MSKRLYNVILKVKDQEQFKFLKYRSVTDVNRLIRWLEKKGIEVNYVNIYDKETKEKLEGYSYKKS